MRIATLATAVCLSVVGLAIAGDAEAAVRKQTNISPQGLGPALQALATERNFQVIYLSDSVESLQSVGAVGDLTTDEALTRILSGTGMTFRYLDDNTVTVISAAPRSGEAATSGLNGPGVPPVTDDGFQRLALAVHRQSPQASEASLPGKSQEQRSEASASTSIVPRLGEVIVTAQKRQERLIDVPLSMSVLSADDLTRIGALQFRDFANTVPALTFSTQGAGFTQVSLRGVTTGIDIGPTVGVYVDEVPYGSSSSLSLGSRLALDVGLFDLARIEVLRGPQGTLYGASTMGGLLKYVTRRPDAESFDVYAQAGVSDIHDGGVSYNVAATVNAPIVIGKVALRTSGFYSRDGGYINNLALGKKEVNHADIYGGRADLLLTPTDALAFRITGFLQNISREGMALSDYTLAGVPIDGSLDQRRPLAEPFDQRFHLISGTVTYDLGRATLTSISSYQTGRAELVFDLSSLLVPILEQFLGRAYSAAGSFSDTVTDKFTQEVRLAADGSRPFEWVIGGFYNHETTDVDQKFILRDLTGQPALNDILTFAAPQGFEEYAAFGDLTWYLTDKFDVSGGLRFSHYSQDVEQIGSGLFGASLPATSSSDDVFTYLANARYHFNDRTTLYLRYATGYRPGGPNFVVLDPATGLPAGPKTFGADRLKSYEAGFKAETADLRFGIDLAGYYINWSDIQVIGVRGGAVFRVNVPDGASISGSELTLTARPTDAFAVTGAFAYQDTKLSKAAPDLGAAKGERLPNVPPFTAALNADYELPYGDLQPTVGATLRYVDSRKAFFGSRAYRLPDYTTVDLRTGLVLDRVNVQFYIHNLFDKRGQASGGVQGGLVGDFTSVSILQPRTVGITATTHF